MVLIKWDGLEYEHCTWELVEHTKVCLVPLSAPLGGAAAIAQWCGMLSQCPTSACFAVQGLPNYAEQLKRWKQRSPGIVEQKKGEVKVKVRFHLLDRTSLPVLYQSPGKLTVLTLLPM